MTLTDGYSDVPGGKLASVVTCLEMSVRPALRPEAVAGRWHLRRVARPELDWYRDLFRRVGSEWLWFSRLSMSGQELLRVLHDPGVEIHVLQVDGADEGLLELDFRAAGECELAFYGLTPRVQGQGAGRWLMNRGIEQAWARPIARFWVHTCTLDHPNALAFYVRSGFRAYARRVEVADDPRASGLLPRTAGSHIPYIGPPAEPPA
jgi:GNAT superfamily N-acetyltransferase